MPHPGALGPNTDLSNGWICPPCHPTVNGTVLQPTIGRFIDQQMDAAPLPRGLAKAVRAALADTPVVCLLGPRQCGKTTLARSVAPDYGYVTFDDEDALTLAARVIAGGFPEPLTRSPDRARAWHRDYVRALLERDVNDVARIKEPRDLTRLLSLLALRTGELLNISTLSNELDLQRETVENHLAACERLYLVRRLQPWHRHAAKRLIKTAKLHFVDSGLAATLANLAVEDWHDQRARFGHLLESFVLQQLTAQAGWTDPDLSFWHYRDKDQVEVDIVITRGRRTWRVEVKATATPTLADISGLRRLAAQCGDDFGGGLLLHAGTHLILLGDPRFLAVPLTKLWEI